MRRFLLLCIALIIIPVVLSLPAPPVQPGEDARIGTPRSQALVLDTSRDEAPAAQPVEQLDDLIIAGRADAPAPKSDEKTGQNFKSTAGKPSIGSRISEFMTNEYGSLAGLGGDLLGLVGGEAYAEWKSAVDKAFCDTVILGGKSCWIAKICGSSPENAGGDGVLVGQKFTNDTLTMRFIAHVEGDRLQPAYNETGNASASYLYRVTYAIRNPQRREPNAFQLRFFYDGGSYDWYPSWQLFNKGSYIKAIGANALVAYSNNYYTRVCLVFRDTVEVNGQPTRQVCNALVQYKGGATTPYGAPAPAATNPAGAAAPVRSAGDGF